MLKHICGVLKTEIYTGEDDFFKHLGLNITITIPLMHILTWGIPRLGSDLCIIRFWDLQNKYVWRNWALKFRFFQNIQCLKPIMGMWASIHKAQTFYITSLYIILSPYGGSRIVIFVILEKKWVKKTDLHRRRCFFQNLVLDITKAYYVIYVLTCVILRLGINLCIIRFRDLQNKCIWQ